MRMDRRTFLSLVAIPAFAALAGACGGDDDDAADTTSDDTGTSGSGETDTTGTTGTTATTGADPTATTGADSTTTSVPGGGSEARSDLVRRQADPADAAVASDAINRFAGDLYPKLAAAAPDANLVFSPASIAIALAMTRAGAVGTTASEMDDVLHIADPAVIHGAMNALTAALESRTGSFPDGGGKPQDVTLAIANSVWAQAGVAFQQAFLDLLAGEYGAGLELTDFAADPDAARVAINEWVNDETMERIPELLSPGSLDPLTRLVLVNAVYLKAPWLYPFIETGTTPGPFSLPDGSTVDVDLMTLDESLPYARGDGWQAVELPYVGDELGLLVIVPDDDLAAVEASVPEGLLEDVASALGAAHVQLRFPKFDIETSAELGGMLAELGMPTPFNPGIADFSGMTTEEQLYISAVVHQANMTVDEKGTEAAAATAVVMRATSAPVEVVELVVDRPFVFALRDGGTGAVLFLGRITDPR